MAVAFDAATDLGTATTGALSGTHTPVGTPRAAVVKIAHGSVATDLITGVTYGGVAMERVGSATDPNTELGKSYIYFLGDSIPTGAQTVTVSHTGTGTTKWATAETFTASADTEITAAGGVDDNISVATVRMYKPVSGMETQMAYLGGDSPGSYTPSANLTALFSIDFGNFSARSDYETANSSGAQSYVLSAATDDVAYSAISISEVAGSGARLLATTIPNATNPGTQVEIHMGGQLVGKELVLTFISRDHTSGTALATISDNGGGNAWSSDLAGDPDRKIYVFEKVGTAADVGAILTITGAVGSLSAALMVFDGVSSLGDLTVETNASGNETHASMDPTTDNSLAVFIIGDYGNDTNAATSISGATSGAFTIVVENASTGGSDSRITAAIDLIASGATGAVTWSQTDSTTKSVLFALPPVGGDQDIDLDTAIENELGKAITPKHQRALSPATENELGKAITPKHQRALGQAIENELARTITPVKPIFVDVGTATEQELGDTITPTRQGDLGTATEQELARAITPVKPILVDVGTATEQELGQTITADKPIFVDVGTATEVELGRIISPLAPHEIAVNPAAEQELARAITPVKPILVDLGPASEQELARAFTAVKPIFVDVGQAIEQELARIIAAEITAQGEIGSGTCSVSSAISGACLVTASISGACDSSATLVGECTVSV